MADAVAQLARINNAWIVAVGGGEHQYAELSEALAAIKVGADQYWKARQAAEKEVTSSNLVVPGMTNRGRR